MRKVNDDVCAIDIVVNNKALGVLRDSVNLNETTRSHDGHVALKNFNYIHEPHNFPAFVILNSDVAELVARALDNASIKVYHDVLADAFYNDENDRAVTYDQVVSDWAQSNMPSYNRPGADYQSAEEFLAEMGSENVNDSTILKNFKMAVDVLLKATP
ncbi:hypothetical protein [Aeromonas dhakensis]|uniref:hypothetical protein n=1 Tax=Aeromonas dhakensis TaxID=196024 RepID=UPI002B486380|nr:hypothetical protein [Aeromonas dhakensis]